MTRTTSEANRNFRQTTHGEQRYGQTPAGMFLEAVNAHTGADGTLPRVSTIRKSTSGKLSVGDNHATREDVLLAVLRAVDGHLTQFTHDDYSARLIVLDDASRIAWVEMLNPGADATAHPELGRGF